MLVIGTAIVCGGAVAADQASFVAAYEKAVADPVANIEQFLEVLPKVETGFGPKQTLYVVEGDMVLDKEGVERYLLQKSGEGQDTLDNPELIVHVEGGQLARWAPDDRDINFAVVRTTFPSEESYQQVINDMNAAADDWEKVCTDCGIDLKHLPEHDGITTWEEFLEIAATKSPFFVVVFNSDPNGPIASAFFPTSQQEEQVLMVFPEYFALGESGYSGQGVLRHELGHVLGYRHEHTRGVPGCGFEDNSWYPVTPYDPHSVMHYYCGGAGTTHLELSDLDRLGHTANYKNE